MLVLFFQKAPGLHSLWYIFHSMKLYFVYSGLFSFATLSFHICCSHYQFRSSLLCVLVFSVSSVHVIKRVLYSSFGKPSYNPCFFCVCFYFLVVWIVAQCIYFFVLPRFRNPFLVTLLTAAALILLSQAQQWTYVVTTAKEFTAKSCDARYPSITLFAYSRQCS